MVASEYWVFTCTLNDHVIQIIFSYNPCLFAFNIIFRQGLLYSLSHCKMKHVFTCSFSFLTMLPLLYVCLGDFIPLFIQDKCYICQHCLGKSPGKPLLLLVAWNGQNCMGKIMDQQPDSKNSIPFWDPIKGNFIFK